jgi:hypothetical protein
MYARLARRYEQTLLEACQQAGIPSPVSHDDLMRTYRVLREKGIAHNMMYEPTWMEAIYGAVLQDYEREELLDDAFFHRTLEEDR